MSDWSVNDNERCSPHGGGTEAVEAESGIQHSLHSGNHNPELTRFTSGHHSVGGHFPDRSWGIHRRTLAEDVVRVQLCLGEKGVDSSE